MGTTTTTFALNKPTVGGDDNAWGTDWNTNADKLDDLLDGTTGITPNLLTGWKVGGVAVTATAAELNILDGVTASTAEINVLDGVTASTAELNILDGVTASTAELNFVDGVTSAIQTQLDAKQAADATLTSLSGLSLAAGDVFYATAADAVQRLAIGTAGQVLTVNSGATAPEWGSGGITLGTSVASTSGTAIDFTGIPATATRVTAIFRGVSLSGTDDILVQLGVSGGPVTTGYFSIGERPGASPSSTSGAIVAIGAAAAGFSGKMVFQKITGNVWVWDYTGALSSTARPSYGGGDVDLGGVLTQVRFTRTGTNTFDAGTVNVSWE